MVKCIKGKNTHGKKVLAAFLAAILVSMSACPVHADALMEEATVSVAEKQYVTEEESISIAEPAEPADTAPDLEITTEDMEGADEQVSQESGEDTDEQETPAPMESVNEQAPSEIVDEESSTETADAEVDPESADSGSNVEVAGEEEEGSDSSALDAELTFESDDEELLNDNEAPELVASGQVITGTNGLPTLNIILANASLAQIKSGSKATKYQGNSVYMSGAGSAPAQTNVEVKGRGNSTWDCPKKPFQIKFEKKQELFGQGKAKKWILLANYLDTSHLRNDIGLSLAQMNKVPGAIPRGQFVEVYFNGVYEGLYYLTRKVEVGTVPLQDDKGIIVEFEHIRTPDEPSGYSVGGSRLGTKETVIDSDVMAEQKAVFDSFMRSYNAFEKAAMNKDWKTASQYADMESFAKVFLLADYSGGQDMFGSSCYIHKDGDNDVLHAGPMWDFDISYAETIIQITPETQNPYRTWAYMDVRECPDSREVLKKWAPLYEYLMNMPEFRELVRTVYWNTVRKTMVEVSQSIGQRSYVISAARKRDLAKWHNGSSGGTEAAVVERYMKERIRYFDLLYSDVRSLSGIYKMDGAYAKETVRVTRTADGYYILSNRNGDVLDVTGAKKANGAGVKWASYSGADSQKWLPLANGAIISKETGFLLTDQAGAFSISRVSFSGERPSAAQTFSFAKTTVNISSAINNTLYVVTKAGNASIPSVKLFGANLKEGVDYTLSKTVSNTGVRYSFTGVGAYTGKQDVFIKVAHSGTLDREVFYRISSKLDRAKVLTIKGGNLARCGNVQLESFSGMLEDYWFFEAQADGTYIIRNARSGMALDIEGGATKNGANVQQYTPNGTQAQKFILDKRSGGAYEIISVKSQKAVDVTGGSRAENTNIQQYTPNATGAQRWYIEASGIRPTISGTCKLVACTGKADKAVSVAGTSRENGANILLWDAAVSASAKWVLRENNDINRTWSIRSAYSGKAIDVTQDGKKAGTNVCQYTYVKEDISTKWVIMKNVREDTFTIFSICSGLALDVSGGSGKNGANIQIYTPNGTAAQKWKLQQAV